MQSSSVPPKVPVPFANSGAKTTIPTASQIGITPGAASLTDGFPPLTRTPKTAGGVPPTGSDMNGILWLISAWSRWSGAGGPVIFDSAFATAIGGYPAGAILASTTVGRRWLNTVDNNATNPDTGGAGWAMIQGNRPDMASFPSSGTFTAPLGLLRIKVRIWGAGGGGGGAANAGSAASGGGGGGYVEGVFAVTPGQSYAVTVGTAGSGGAGSSAANGTAGGSSSFSSVATATGGQPGLGTNGAVQNNAGTGGTGTGGALSLNGFGGGGAFSFGSGVYGGGHGGGTFGTTNTGPTTGSGILSGQTGAFPGGGGGGGILGGNGGVGAAGLVILEW
jgi:hypothetical protein